MKIRLMGLKDELDVAVNYYEGLKKELYIKGIMISLFYNNRGSNCYRVYVDIEYYDSYLDLMKKT
jgi:hypothetical protein